MSVNNGQQANQTTFNGAFISRTTDSDTVAVVGLKNPGSGGDIINAQQQINDNKTLSVDNKSRLDNLSIDDCVDVDTTTNPPLAGSYLEYDGAQWVPGYASDNVELLSPGTVSWDLGSNTLTLNDNIYFTYKEFNPDSNQVDAAGIVLNADGKIAYIDINTTTNSPTSLTVNVIDVSSYTEVPFRVVFARRVGTKIYFGYDDTKVLNDGDTIGFEQSMNRDFSNVEPAANDIDMNSNKVVNAADPTDPQDYATKNYVDSATGSAIASSTGSSDADKLIKTAADGFLDKTFNNTIPSFSDESSFTTFLDRAAVVGDRFFDTTVMALKIYDGTQFVISSGTGGGGDINFIDNGDAEINIDGWNTFADAAASRPVDGTGGTANITFSRSTSSPLDGDASFIFTKDAVNRQGEGASYDFPISDAYKAKVLNIEADYIIDSGTFVAGTSTADSDLIFYLYDIDNSVLIEPSSFKLLSNSSTISDKFRGTFQTPYNSNNYRLIIYVASTSAAAYSVKFDNIKVTPSKYVYGTPSVDFGTENWTVTGVTGTSSLRVTREGRRIYIDGYININSAASSQIGLTIPTAYAADTTVYDLSAVSNPVGLIRLQDTGSTFYDAVLQLNSSTSLSTIGHLANGTYVIPQGTNATQPFTWASGDKIYVTGSWIASGFSSSTQMSDLTDTRVVAMTARSSGGQSIPNNSETTVIFGTVDFDTHGCYNPANGNYTVKIPGKYRISAIVTLDVGAASGNRIVYAKKNGGYLSILSNFSFSSVRQGCPGSVDVDCVAGDILTVTSYQNSGGSINTFANNVENVFSIDRISGPSAIAASELVSVRATTTAGQALGTSVTDIIYGTVSHSTHGNYNSSTGVFTANVSGIYEYSAKIAASVNLSTSQGIVIRGEVNGSLHSLYQNIGSGTLSIYFATITDQVRLSAGDTIKITGLSNVATTLTTFDGFNTLSIKRIGL